MVFSFYCGRERTGLSSSVLVAVRARERTVVDVIQERQATTNIRTNRLTGVIWLISTAYLYSSTTFFCFSR